MTPPKTRKATAAHAPDTTRRRRPIHIIRAVLADADEQGRRVVSAFVAIAFAQEGTEAGKNQRGKLADQLHGAQVTQDRI